MRWDSNGEEIKGERGKWRGEGETMGLGEGCKEGRESHKGGERGQK